MAVLGEHYARLRARLAARPDTEHEQAIVRLLVGTVLFFYLLPRAITHLGVAVDPDPSYFAVMVVYLVCAALIFADILLSPGVSVPRRLLAAVLDIGTVTFFMSQSGSHGVPMLLIYVWVPLANVFCSAWRPVCWDLA
jgi:two-component system sensor histidine kinase RpfC